MYAALKARDKTAQGIFAKLTIGDLPNFRR